MSILDPYGNPMKSRPTAPRGELIRLRREVATLRSKYDTAQDTEGSKLHWANADNTSPHSANSAGVRQKLRARSRYEIIENNAYLKGVIITLANDFVGSGPKLQIVDNRFNEKQIEVIERKWKEWGAKIRLRQKLWRMRMAKVVDGESFALKVTNNRLRYPVTLDLRIIEADQWTSDSLVNKREGVNEVDGIRFDDNDMPLEYHLMNTHPGSNLVFTMFPESFHGEWVPADSVVHWFRQDRGWLRGIPELTPSLPLCALLRRYTLAVVQSAEIAADISVLLEQDAPPDTTLFGDMSSMSQSEIEDQFFDAFPFMRGMIMSLPFGTKASQMKAEQPTTMFDKFVDTLLREILRPVNVPFNIGVGFSGGYNFASGTLDKQIYWNAQQNERLDCGEVVLDSTFDSWWEEAVLVADYFEQDVIAGDQPIDIATTSPLHTWGWDREPDHPDPAKVASSMIALHNAGHLSDRDIQEGHLNRNVEEHYENLRRQRQARSELGVGEQSQSDNEPKEEEEEEEEEVEE